MEKRILVNCASILCPVFSTTLTQITNDDSQRKWTKTKRLVYIHSAFCLNLLPLFNALCVHCSFCLRLSTLLVITNKRQLAKLQVQRRLRIHVIKGSLAIRVSFLCDPSNVSWDRWSITLPLCECGVVYIFVLCFSYVNEHTWHGNSIPFCLPTLLFRTFPWVVMRS